MPPEVFLHDRNGVRGQPHSRPRRRRGGKRWSAKRRFAMRLPRDLKPTKPGGLIQIDTCSSTSHPTRRSSTSRLLPGRQMDRRQSLQPRHRRSGKSLPRQGHRRHAVRDRSDPGRRRSEFKAEFEAAYRHKRIRLYKLPPKRPQINGAVERCNGSWRYEFYASYELPRRSKPSTRSSIASSTSTITTDRTALLPEARPPSTSPNAEPTRARRLICIDPGQPIDSKLESCSGCAKKRFAREAALTADGWTAYIAQVDMIARHCGI
jgi:hypothetical protein